LVLPGLVLIAACCSSAWAASSYVPDSDTSTRLSDYLHSHRLPLVGAQVLNSSSGRSVLLFGYTATDFGKSDAETKTRRFLRDSDVVINNHIRVDPELAAMRSSAPPQPPPESSQQQQPPPPDQLGDIDSYKNQQQDNSQQQYMNQQAQQYMNQGTGPLGVPSSALSILIPLLGMGMGGGIGIGGGGTSFGMGGMGVSPGFGGGNGFGGGYGSPYGGGYGSPYGGANPYGPSPYGPSPYGAPGAGSTYP
jgi:hypothetical protein